MVLGLETVRGDEGAKAAAEPIRARAAMDFMVEVNLTVARWGARAWSSDFVRRNW